MTWRPSRAFLLWTLIALFLGVAALLVWSMVLQSRTTFSAGSRPPLRESDLPQPIKPVMRASDPWRGSTDPKAITIIAFGDFDCVYCKLADMALSQALSSSRDVRIVWRDLPIPNGRTEGLMAAIAGRCAAEQNRFWQMHDALFQSTDLTMESFKRIARETGLRESTFLECFSNAKVLQAVQDDVALAKSLSITSTPTFFIGNDVLLGAVSADEILASIKRARSALR